MKKVKTVVYLIHYIYIYVLEMVFYIIFLGSAETMIEYLKRLSWTPCAPIKEIC